jgi:hypothetical protein
MAREEVSFVTLSMDAPVVGTGMADVEMMASRDGGKSSPVWPSPSLDFTDVPSPDSSSDPADPPDNQFKRSPPTDLSSLPHLLQKSFDDHGSSNTVRPGIIRTGHSWKRQRRENLFSPSRETALNVESQKGEKKRAFDLLDALTRSGGLTVEGASVHVVLASSHYFDQSLMNTVIQRNVNPLVKLEESMRLMASVIHEKPVEELVE